MNGQLDELKRDRGRLVEELTEAGTEFRGKACRCPFCDDRNPSAGVYQTDGGRWLYKCHKCGASGSVVDVIAWRTGSEPSAVIRSLTGDSLSPCARRGVPSAERKPSRVFASIEEAAQACPQPVVETYRYTDPASDAVEMVVFRCEPPGQKKTFRQGRPCADGWELRAPPKPWPLYNRTRIQKAETVVVTEGEKDVHSLHEYGITATTSPGGAGKAAHADWQPLAGKNVVLWPDFDDVGKEHMQQVRGILAKLNPPARVNLIDVDRLDLQLKDDVSDFISQCKNAGQDVRAELDRVLQSARPRTASGDVKQRIGAIAQGEYKSVKLPWTLASKITHALLPGTVTLLCGSPGASKSFILLQALSYWIDNGVKACVYELEEDTTYHLMRLLAQRAKEPGLTNSDWIQANPELAGQAYEQHAAFLDEAERHIHASDDAQPTLDQVASWIATRARAGDRVIAVDPVTAAAPTSKPWVADADFMQAIKRTAVEYGVSILLVTHPSKQTDRPDMNSLAGGASYSRFAQTILWLEPHPEPKSSKVKMTPGTIEQSYNRTLHILKARNGIGQGVRIACDFQGTSLELNELGIIVK